MSEHQIRGETRMSNTQEAKLTDRAGTLVATDHGDTALGRLAVGPEHRRDTACRI